MTKSRFNGVPRNPRITAKEVEAIILTVLRDEGGEATWAKLLEKVGAAKMPDKTLIAGLNRLMAARTVAKEAQMIAGKARSVYKLILPIPDLEPEEFREGWRKFIEDAAEKAQEARNALDAFDTQVVDTSSVTPEFWLPYLQANEEIGRMAHAAVAVLGTTILSILRDYSQTEDPVAAALYLKTAAEAYIPSLIKDIARITPPGSNFDYPAMGIAVAGLFGKEAIEERVTQMRKDMQGSNKSESEIK